ncbi:hypothetical protein C8F01DRAFT_1252736 [Mycena amicta]|nr:hypothetical protein C8F01DRAFT_1252736 [Mycena amicta]
MLNEEFQQQLNPPSIDFSEVADRFPLLAADPAPAYAHSSDLLPPLPATPAPFDPTSTLSPPKVQLRLPDHMAQEPHGYNEPFLFDSPPVEDRAPAPPYNYYGLDVGLAPNGPPIVAPPQPLGLKNSDVVQVQIVAPAAGTKQRKGKKNADLKTQVAADPEFNGAKGRGWTGDDYLTLARAYCDVKPWLSGHGQIGQSWARVAAHLEANCFCKSVSTQSLKLKMKELLAYKAGSRPDLVKAGSSAAISLAGVLEQVVAGHAEAKGKSDGALASLKKKREREQAEGDYIRQQSMNTLRQRVVVTKAPTVKIYETDDDGPIDVETESDDEGLPANLTLASAKLSRNAAAVDARVPIPATPAPVASSSSTSTVLDNSSGDESDDDKTAKLPLKKDKTRTKRKAIDVDSDSDGPPRKKVNSTKRSRAAARRSSSSTNELLEFMREESARNDRRWTAAQEQRSKTLELFARALLPANVKLVDEEQ